MKVKGNLKQLYAGMAWLPNLLTCLRIVGAIALLFAMPVSTFFYVVYALCGLTDVLDGFLARKLKTASAVGAKLDSVADLSFYTVMIVRLLPLLRKRLPKWIWYVVAFVICVRLAAYLVSAIKLRRFASLHTIANKLTGAAVFGIGLATQFSWLTIYCVGVCVVGLLSSTQELLIHLRESQETVVK